MPELITNKWATFLADFSFEAMPADAVHQTKLLALDSIGCALGGYANESGKKVAALGRDLGGTPEAVAIGGGERLHCANAAYVNGKLSNILDADETLYHTRHIGGISVFPAISVAERVKASGKDVIVATAMGYDMAARSAFCGSAFRVDPGKGLVVGAHASAAFNTLGAAVAAGRVFGFDSNQMVNLLGTAGYLATGAIESRFVSTPTSNFNKYGDMGWFCHGGVMAALCTLNGYVGDPSMLDGPRGVMALVGALDFDEKTFVAGLGERWYINDAGFKPHPTCRWFNNAVDMLEQIMARQDLKAADIERIIVKTHPMALDLPSFAAAFQWADLPEKNYWRAINSLSYAMACTALGITPGPLWAKPETMNSPLIAQMTRKVVHLEHPEAVKTIANWTGHPGRVFTQPPTSIEVVSGKGNFSCESSDTPGDSWNPRSRMSDDAIRTKFRNNAGHVLDDAKIEAIIERVEGLEHVRDMGELTALLAA